ncbi:CopG family transcriptional regulator [Rhodopseudomonas sp. BR0G17]|nr:CopG family transcriptional regulator [Rhodopseudomonas sp. BR0G17]
MSSKQIISVRLSVDTLARLDEACRLLKVNRSDAIDRAIRLLPDVMAGSSELQYHPENRKPGPGPSSSEPRKGSTTGGAGGS